jgi:hypothetical protein
VDYLAVKHEVTWNVTEFRMTKSGMVCARDKDGAWKIRWESPKTRVLALVYSFGTIHAFGRKVYDYTDGKWEALEKIFADRESIADSKLIVSGSGPGWTWDTVRNILGRAKKVNQFKLRSGERVFEFVRPARAAEAPVKIHLCAGKKLLEGHLKDPEKHAKDVRKLAEEPSFGDATYLWANDKIDAPLVLSHPMSDEEFLKQDRQAVAKFVRALGEPACVVLQPDLPISFEHVMLVATSLVKAGVKDVRLPE